MPANFLMPTAPSPFGNIPQGPQFNSPPPQVFQAGPNNGGQPSPNGPPIGMFGAGTGQAQTWGGAGSFSPPPTQPGGGVPNSPGYGSQGPNPPQGPRPPGGGAPGSATFLDQLGTAVGQDTANLDQAERQRFNASNQDLNRAGSALEALPGDMQRAGEQAAGSLDKLGGEFRDAGEQAASRFNQAVKPGLDRSNRFADEAVAHSKDAESKFSTDTTRFADSLHLGIKARYQDQIDQLTRGQNADGTPLDPRQKLAMSEKLQQTMGRDITQATQQLFGSLQGTMANLRTSTSNTMLSAGESARAGAALSTQATAEGERARQGYADMRKGLAEASASLRSAGKMRGLELRAQGMPQLAELRDRFAYAPTSLFSGLASLGAVASAPGGRTMQGLNLPQNIRPETPPNANGMVPQTIRAR